MKVHIWIRGSLGWEAGIMLETLPNLRASDLVALVGGLAIPGNLVQYGGRFYEMRNRQLRILTRDQHLNLGLSVTEA